MLDKGISLGVFFYIMEQAHDVKIKAFKGLILASPLILIAVTLLVGYLLIY